jgi:hypothetical protein
MNARLQGTCGRGDRSVISILQAPFEMSIDRICYGLVKRSIGNYRVFLVQKQMTRPDDVLP